MLLYRYLNLTYGLDALQTGKWKIGRLAKLNDVFDCRPRIRNLPRMVCTEDKYLELLNGLLGLICYAETINDPALWGHYADVHRGIALGFEFSAEDRDFPHKVSYSKERPILDFNEIGIDAKDSDPDEARRRLIDTGFSTKHPSWIYEQEYRHFVTLDGCEMRGENYFNLLPWNRLKKIILGAHCSVTMKDIERVVLAREADYLSKGGSFPRPAICKCQIDPDSYDLGFDGHGQSA
jgi:hypothetical protein